MVIWWNQGEGNSLQIACLVQCRKGFTARLLRYRDQLPLTIIDGPYGVSHDFGSFGTIIMFATGIGIAGHLPYLKELVHGYNNRVVRTRYIILVWQLDKECHQEWVSEWMDEVLQADTDRILKISLYVLGDYLVPRYFAEVVSHGYHNRIRTIYAPAKVGEILKDEITNRKGKTLVSTCTDEVINDIIKNCVTSEMDSNLRLVQLDFHPPTRPRPLSSELDYWCQGEMSEKAIELRSSRP
ncbi:MAG: hypothetical protein M1834_008505 [Cirrosporium novae-zelandiae]|nr:MAG: hypothetical protein M1834_008505 [Cirrosporium novae-zelandiae]